MRKDEAHISSGYEAGSTLPFSSFPFWSHRWFWKTLSRKSHREDGKICVSNVKFRHHWLFLNMILHTVVVSISHTWYVQPRKSLISILLRFHKITDNSNPKYECKTGNFFMKSSLDHNRNFYMWNSGKAVLHISHAKKNFSTNQNLSTNLRKFAYFIIFFSLKMKFIIFRWLIDRHESWKKSWHTVTLFFNMPNQAFF